MLDLREHLKHITADVRKLVKVLTRRLLSPNSKKLAIDQLLKSKYHATHSGIFIDKQLETVHILLNKAARYAIGLTPSFLTEAVHRPATEMSLGYTPMNNRATQIGIEHITNILNKPANRGHISHAHTTRVANTYHH
jgi:hypothetical protein